MGETGRVRPGEDTRPFAMERQRQCECECGTQTKKGEENSDERWSDWEGAGGSKRERNEEIMR